jgi:geranylgeranyl reductase family protein
MKYDVVVVGAGPAGSTAAKVLAIKGINVLLLDKETFPRDKPCAGGLPARVLKRFPYIEKNNLIDSYSHSMCIHTSSLKYKIDIVKNEPIVAMVLRNAFDTGLVNLASQSGAVFLGGKTAVHIKTDIDQASLILNDGTTIDASYVIAADGMWSKMTKQLFGPQNPQNIGLCVLEEYPMSKKIMDQFFGEQRCIHIHMNVFGMAGYGWVFPKKEHVNIGLSEFRHAINPEREKKNLKALYGEYIKLLKENKIIPENLKIKAVKGGVFPTVPIEQTFTTRTLLCGDAGGLANPLTGEGIYYAMVSGEIAGKTLLRVMESNHSYVPALSNYQREWMNDFGEDHRRFFRISKGWRINTERFVRLAAKDQKIVDIALNAILEPLSIKKIRWKIMRRFFYIYVKNKLGMLPSPEESQENILK